MAAALDDVTLSVAGLEEVVARLSPEPVPPRPSDEQVPTSVPVELIVAGPAEEAVIVSGGEYPEDLIACAKKVVSFAANELVARSPATVQTVVLLIADQ